jgi:acetyl-CoA C-acetyltransferase
MMHTPILVGVGQYIDRIEDPEYRALSVAELGAEAARRALNDALNVTQLASQIDVVVGVRQFETSTPDAVAVFGRSNNFPRSVMQRLGHQPARAVLEVAGGQSPQKLVNEFAEVIAAGQAQLVLLVGAEAISTQRHLISQGQKPDWFETIAGSLEDRGYGIDGIITPDLIRHQLLSASLGYALFDNARRARLGQARDAYRQNIGTLFAPFTRVAAQNPYATAPKAYSAAELSAVTERNRLIAEPYTRLVVSRDQVNQAAALLLTSVEHARALGIPEDTWVYLHGYAHATEHTILERADLSRSPAAIRASETALAAAGKTMAEMTFIDLYSCFANPVFNIADAFGLSADDPRGLTVTGGLPFFGGAGNNYSMHAIASMAERLRAQPGSIGFVGANGGFMSKYAVGIYSTSPTDFTPVDNRVLQAEIDAQPSPTIVSQPIGLARIETYTVEYDRAGRPERGIIIGRLGDESRFIANTPDGDGKTLQRLADEQAEPVGMLGHVGPGLDGRNLFRLAYPGASAAASDAAVVSERCGRVLIVTINRPRVRNAINDQVAQGIEAALDAAEQDDSLAAVIITGAGDKSFSAGADLKYAATGGMGMVTAKGGFAGIVKRAFPKPLIAAVNGTALGGGFEIALSCDLIVAAEQAVFGLPEVKRGLIAGAGGLIRVGRLLPRPLALEIAMTGEPISAQRARELGLVSRVVPTAALLDIALSLAELIASNGPLAVRLSKELVTAAPDLTMDEAWARNDAYAQQIVRSEDMREGLQAFAEKRRPNWKGR